MTSTQEIIYIIQILNATMTNAVMSSLTNCNLPYRSGKALDYGTRGPVFQPVQPIWNNLRMSTIIRRYAWSFKSSDRWPIIPLRYLLIDLMRYGQKRNEYVLMSVSYRVAEINWMTLVCHVGVRKWIGTHMAVNNGPKWYVNVARTSNVPGLL